VACRCSLAFVSAVDSLRAKIVNKGWPAKTVAPIAGRSATVGHRQFSAACQMGWNSIGICVVVRANNIAFP
jgi:hypothetical protein